MDVIIRSASGAFAINLRNVCAFSVREVPTLDRNAPKKFAVYADMDNSKNYMISSAYLSTSGAVKAFDDLQKQIYNLTKLPSSKTTGVEVIHMKG